MTTEPFLEINPTTFKSFVDEAFVILNRKDAIDSEYDSLLESAEESTGIKKANLKAYFENLYKGKLDDIFLKAKLFSILKEKSI